MPRPTLALTCRHIVTPDGVREGAVLIHAGRIAAVAPADEADAAERVEDLGSLHLLPGLVDTHVHINAPGRSHWEGFESLTRAAAAGGVTTLVDMPLNSIPATCDVASLEQKRAAARGAMHVDVGFWGGVVPGNAGQLEPLAAAGVRGFKCFLSPSGVDEFHHVSEADLREALPVLARLGLPLLAHAEDPTLLRAASGDPRSYASWLASRPPEAEASAVRMLLCLCAEFGTRIHVVHVACAEVLPLLREARERGLPVSAETCPHYLTFAAGDIPDGATQYKCAPPIREAAQRAALRRAVIAGDLDFVATDHSPCPPEMKHPEEGNFFTAWGGIASLQLGLAATWTALAEAGATPLLLAERLCVAPARLAGLQARKGRIAAGWDADLVAWDPDAREVVRTEALLHRHPVCPYEGMELRGRVERTYLRGECVYERGAGVIGNPRGETL